MSTTTNPIGVGIMGLGNSGWFYHAEDSIEPNGGFEIVALSGSSPARLAAAADRFTATPHPTNEALLADDRVELVVVTAPTGLHAPLARAALEAGKHVVVDKPLAPTTAEALELRALAEDAGRILTVFQNRRWEPSFIRVREIVASGAIGEVWRVEERRIHAGPYRVSADDRPHAGDDVATWTTDIALGGGVTYLIAPHLVDHQLALFERAPNTVAARMHTHEGDRAEHYVEMQLDFGDDVIARIEVMRDPAVNPPRWTVYGTRGTILVPTITRLELKVDGMATTVEEGFEIIRGSSPFYEQMRRVLREGAEPPVPLGDSVLATHVLDLAHRSARAGGLPISVDAGVIARR